MTEEGRGMVVTLRMNSPIWTLLFILPSPENAHSRAYTKYFGTYCSSWSNCMSQEEMRGEGKEKRSGKRRGGEGGRDERREEGIKYTEGERNERRKMRGKGCD